MDSNILLLVIGTAALTVGAVIGFLLGRSWATNAERECAKFEARAEELQKQIGQKDVEILRLNEQDRVKQTRLTEAESARTKAETELREASEQITTLRRAIDQNKSEISTLCDSGTGFQNQIAELNAENRTALSAIGEHRQTIVDLSEEIDTYEKTVSSLQSSNTELKEQNADLNARYESALRSIEEQKNFLSEADKKLREAFESLSSEALRKNNTSFIELANEKLNEKVTESTSELEKRKQAIDSLVKPLGETLTKFDEKLGEIELKREGAYSQMTTLLDLMKGTTDQLNLGTKQLVSALKTSHVRGRYGEIGLRRLVEAAGMTSYCDFTEQDSVNTEDGRLRPDMTIHLPGYRELILDSKVPLASYLRTFETDDEAEQKICLKAHAAAVRDHLKKLGQKSYWEQFEKSPDFVVMYLEIESSYGTALMTDPDLILEAINHNIVFATPSTLIGMLRTVGYMWQQEKMAESILEIRDAGIELYNRTNKLLEHFTSIGGNLGKAVNAYNDAVGSLEVRFIPHVTKMKDIGGSLMQKAIPDVKPIEISIREVNKALLPGGSNTPLDATIIE